MSTEATSIRDAMFALLQTLPGWTKVRRVPVRQLAVADCPALTIVLGEENATADEDATAGPPHFVHEATYHISIVRALNDPDTLDGQTDNDMDAVQNLLLRNVALNSMVEGFTAMRRTRDYPQEGETYMAELRLELTAQFRSLWNPFITDDFSGAAAFSLPAQAARVCVRCNTANLHPGPECHRCGASLPRLDVEPLIVIAQPKTCP